MCCNLASTKGLDSDHSDIPTFPPTMTHTFENHNIFIFKLLSNATMRVGFIFNPSVSLEFELRYRHGTLGSSVGVHRNLNFQGFLVNPRAIYLIR